MAWTAADIPDQSGRVAVVTGANGGLGLEVARELARKGGHVVMAARDQVKAEAARTSIHREVPDASLELQPLDLASQRSVREAAAQILAGQPTIDILVNNAGVMGIPERRTEDGFELQLAVNHLGHFALTALLLPALLARAGARVVSVTSTGGTPDGRWTPPTPTWPGATIPGGPTGSPSWPTCTSPWSWIGACGQRGCRPGASSSIRGSPTPTCRPAACARPAVAVVSGSSAPLSSGSG
jgi:NAD(P)-dependent dehydrogenase (short-subunit alcohol dehydrogenase family)